MDELEFIKLNFVNAETTVRAYDTKSQIVLASTAFSFIPIFNSINRIDSTAWVTFRLGVLLSLFSIVLLMFLRVLAPVTLKGVKQGKARGGLFFLRDPSNLTPGAYLNELAAADLKTEYANEVLALHAIRIVKHKRFQQALFVLTTYFGLVFLYGVALLTHLF